MGFRRSSKVLDVNEIGLAEALPLALNKPAFLIQFIQQLHGLLRSTGKCVHDILDGIDDIHAPLLIQPAILGRQTHAIKEQAVEDFGLCRNVLEPAVRMGGRLPASAGVQKS